jgi:hypothetical protein
VLRRREQLGVVEGPPSLRKSCQSRAPAFRMKTLSPTTWLPVPNVASAIATTPQIPFVVTDAQLTPTLHGESSVMSFMRRLRCASTKYESTSRRSGSSGPSGPRTCRAAARRRAAAEDAIVVVGVDLVAEETPGEVVVVSEPTSRSGAQKNPFTFTWRPNVTAPGPFARTVMRRSPGPAAGRSSRRC